MNDNRQGWLIVALGFVVLSLSFSARSALGLAMPVWEQDLGWSRSLVSNVGAMTLLMVAFAAPFSGNLLDRWGARRLLGAGLCSLILGLTLTASMSEPWHFYLGFGVLGGIGFGIVANHVIATLVATHFVANRGLATGIATAGSTAGQLLIMPALAAAIAAVGWRPGFAALAISAVILLPAAYWLAGNKPEPARRVAAAPAESLPARLRMLFTSPVFHALFWSFMICGFTTAGVIEVHLLPYAAACGFPPLQSATAYGVLCAFNLLGMVSAGYLADRIHRPLLLGGLYVLRGLSFILLMNITDNLPLLLIFAVAFGLFDYSTMPVTASIVASHLGLRIMGLAMGLLASGHAFGGAMGAYMGGVLFDLFARYDWVWLVSIGLAVAAGLMVFTIAENRGMRGLRPQPA